MSLKKTTVYIDEGLLRAAKALAARTKEYEELHAIRAEEREAAFGRRPAQG